MKNKRKDFRKQAKIICTIGPASESLSVLRQMMQAGMDVARLNFSHGESGEHERCIRSIRTLNRSHGFGVKVLQDLEGYRIRVGLLPRSKPIVLKKGQIVFLTNKPGHSGTNIIPFDYEGSLDGIRPGMHIFIDDGNIELVVKASRKSHLEARAAVSGIIKERKGINIPQFRMPQEGLTKKDRENIMIGLKNRVEYIAQSFVRSRRDLEHVINMVRSENLGTKIIAKIENREGIRNLDEILRLADGLMVARGDLGVSVPIYQIPMIQKMIIKKCNRKKKFVITATHMLESMTQNLRPTRAEVTDVANAVLDGSNFLMLSGETAVGKHPVEAVSMMAQIIGFTRKEILK